MFDYYRPILHYSNNLDLLVVISLFLISVMVFYVSVIRPF